MSKKNIIENKDKINKKFMQDLLKNKEFIIDRLSVTPRRITKSSKYEILVHIVFIEK